MTHSPAKIRGNESGVPSGKTVPEKKKRNAVYPGLNKNVSLKACKSRSIIRIYKTATQREKKQTNNNKKQHFVHTTTTTTTTTNNTSSTTTRMVVDTSPSLVVISSTCI
jgi:hypothetical protein